MRLLMWQMKWAFPWALAVAIAWFWITVFVCKSQHGTAELWVKYYLLAPELELWDMAEKGQIKRVA